MNSFRNTATWTGVLFILGTGAGVLLGAVAAPVLHGPNLLAQISARPGQMTAAICLQLVMAFACAGIGISLYPVLKTHHAGMAFGSAAFRVMEGMNGVIAAICLALLLALSRELASARTPAASLQALGAAFGAVYDWVNNVPLLLTWHIGALLYYAAFYQTQLLPRWLSVWGLVGVALSVVYCGLILFGVASSADALASGLNAPIFLQELAMALWLIVKGFGQAASSTNLKSNTTQLHSIHS